MRPLLFALLLAAALHPAEAQSPFTPEIPVAPPNYVGIGKSLSSRVSATAGDQTLVAWTVEGDTAVHARRLDAHANPVDEDHLLATDAPNPRLAVVGDHWLLLSLTGGAIRATPIRADGTPAETSIIRTSIAFGARWAFSSGGNRILIIVSEFFGSTGYVLDPDRRLLATTPGLQSPNAQVSVAGSGSDFIVRMQVPGAPFATYVRIGLDGAVLARRDLSTLLGDGGMVWDGRQYFAWAQTPAGPEAMVLGADLGVGPMFRLTAATDATVDWISPIGSAVVVGSTRNPNFFPFPRPLLLTRLTPPANPTADLPLDENALFRPMVNGRGDDLLMVWERRSYGGLLAAPLDPATLAPDGPPRVILGQPLLPESWAAAGADGKLFALWEERVPGQAEQLMARLFTRAGPAGNSRSLGYYSHKPAITFDGERYWTAWLFGGRVEVQHFDRDGEPPFNRLPFPISPAGAVQPEITNVSIAASAGQIVVVWALANGATQGATFSADPQFFRPALFTISGPDVGNLGATLAVSGQRALVAWLRPEPPQGVPVEEAPRDIVVTAFTLSGLPISPVPLPVAPAVVGRSRPVAASDGNAFLVVWWDPESGGVVVRACAVSADGIPGPARAIARTATADAKPALIRSGGTYRLSWIDGGRALTQRLADDGAPLGAPSVLWEEADGVQLADIGDGFAAIGRHPAPDPALPPFDRLFIRFSLPQSPRVRAVR